MPHTASSEALRHIYYKAYVIVGMHMLSLLYYSQSVHPTRPGKQGPNLYPLDRRGDGGRGDTLP